MQCIKLISFFFDIQLKKKLHLNWMHAIISVFGSVLFFYVFASVLLSYVFASVLFSYVFVLFCYVFASVLFIYTPLQLPSLLLIPMHIPIPTHI